MMKEQYWDKLLCVGVVDACVRVHHKVDKDTKVHVPIMLHAIKTSFTTRAILCNL